MLEKSVRLKERTSCEVGSAEGHLVRKSKERIKWSLFPTGGGTQSGQRSALRL